MSYRTYDYACTTCGATSIELVPRDAVPDELDCSACGGVRTRQFGAPMVLNHSHRDGVGRFSRVKEQSKLRQEAARHKAKGDLKEADRIKKEIKKI